MELNEVFTIEKYSDAYEYVSKNNYIIEEIERDYRGIRQFKILEQPKQTYEQIINGLRARREIECFSIINRGQLWYNKLTEEQKVELDNWYNAWLDVTETMVIPEKPNWLEE